MPGTSKVPGTRYASSIPLLAEFCYQSLGPAAGHQLIMIQYNPLNLFKNGDRLPHLSVAPEMGSYLISKMRARPVNGVVSKVTGPMVSLSTRLL